MLSCFVYTSLRAYPRSNPANHREVVSGLLRRYASRNDVFFSQRRLSQPRRGFGATTRRQDDLTTRRPDGTATHLHDCVVLASRLPVVLAVLTSVVGCALSPERAAGSSVGQRPDGLTERQRICMIVSSCRLVILLGLCFPLPGEGGGIFFLARAF